VNTGQDSPSSRPVHISPRYSQSLRDNYEVFRSVKSVLDARLITSYDLSGGVSVTLWK